MKLAFAFVAAFLSISAFAQDTCDLRVRKLQERLAETNAELRMCQTNQGGGRELEMLRRENQQLAETNRMLQRRIDQLEGRDNAQYICSAACVSSSGGLDLRYMGSATAFNQAEADYLSKQDLSKKFSCNFGARTYKCDMMMSEVPRNFCTAACVSSSGSADERYIAGARGRSLVEAEILAYQELKKTYSCNFGMTVVNCN